MTGMQPGLPRKNGLLAWGVWLWCVVAAFFVFLCVCAIFYDRFPADERIADAIQNVDVPVMGGFLEFVNILGDGWFSLPFVVAVAAGLAMARCWWEAAMLPLVIVPRVMNSALKDLIDRPRPTSDFVHVTDHASGFSFPSGHTVSTATLFGLLFFLIPAAVPLRPLRWTLQAACLLAVVSAGPARVYIGAHWPSDTLAAYLLAFLFLAPLVGAYLVARRRRSQIRPEARADSSPS